MQIYSQTGYHNGYCQPNNDCDITTPQDHFSCYFTITESEIPNALNCIKTQLIQTLKTNPQGEILDDYIPDLIAQILQLRKAIHQVLQLHIAYLLHHGTKDHQVKHNLLVYSNNFIHNSLPLINNI